MKPGRFMLFVTLTAAMLAGALLLAAQKDNRGIGIDAFARRAAGSYYVDSTLVLPDGTAVLGKTLSTFNADGSYNSENTSDFGFGTPPSFRSGRFGSWRQTGRREMVVMYLFFDYDSAGQLVSIGRVRGDVVFDEDFGGYSSVQEAQILMPGQDPLDPNEMPFVIVNVMQQARRIGSH